MLMRLVEAWKDFKKYTMIAFIIFSVVVITSALIFGEPTCN